MLLRTLTLDNFRTYGGRQTINLDPVERARPIVLIGGLNGAGKTTILDALQLTLYGQRARCASRGELPYKSYLLQAIHRRADPAAGAGIELRFARTLDGVEHDYLVRRTWHATPSSVSESVEVEVDGVFDQVLTEQWDERVDDFAPHRISNLFFFDGEKIAELAQQKNSNEVLKTAVFSLLGLELVDRLISDLAILDQKKRRDGSVAFDQGKSQALAVESGRLTTDIERTIQERAATLGLLDQAQAALQKVQEQFRREGGELAEQRGTLESDGQAVEAARSRVREELRQLSLGCLPLAGVNSLLIELAALSNSELESAQRQLVAELLNARDQDLLNKLEGSGAEAKSLSLIASILAEDRTARESSARGSRILGLTAEDVSQLGHLIAAELPAQVERAQSLHRELDRLTEQSVTLERKLRSIPEEGELPKLRDQREECIRRVESINADLEALEHRIQVLRSRHVAVETKYLRELEEELSVAQVNDGIRRKFDRMKLAAETLAHFRARVLVSNLQRVEGAILDSFKALIRKPNLVARVRINPEDFSINLTSSDGLHLERDQLSAGESQLLAVSILWGLAKTSGIPLPVVIDTPLGRLDSEHRRNLVENYFPSASHQVILLSTDEEIKDHRLADLDPYIGRAYNLRYDSDLDRTTIHEGYFSN